LKWVTLKKKGGERGVDAFTNPGRTTGEEGKTRLKTPNSLIVGGGMRSFTPSTNCLKRGDRME